MSIVNKKHACAFTGHRPEKLETPEEYVKEWLEKQIRQAVGDGYTDFISGMQRGVDLWAVEILLKLKTEGDNLRIIAACAFEGMDRSFDDDYKRLYREFLSVADEVNVILDRPTKYAYIKRDEWMVDHANRLIAVFTGAPGGTKKTVEYAQKKGIEIVRF